MRLLKPAVDQEREIADSCFHGLYQRDASSVQLPVTLGNIGQHGGALDEHSQ